MKIKKIILKEGVDDPKLDELDNTAFNAMRDLIRYVKQKYPKAYPDFLKFYNSITDQMNDINSKHGLHPNI